MQKPDDMTLRDWFAGQALPAVANTLAANNGVPDYVIMDLFGKNATGVRREQIAAALAYAIADEMIARRGYVKP